MTQNKTKYPYDPTRPIDLISMGRVGVDFVSEQIGSNLEDAQIFRKYLGGTPGNIAVGVARLGLKVAMFSQIGSDHMGRYLKKTLEKEGVDTTLLKTTPNHLTGLVILGVKPPRIFPHLFYRENCADMQIKPEDVDENFLKKCKALLTTGTGLSQSSMRSATQHAINLAKKLGTAVVLDIDYRPVLWGLTVKGDGDNQYVKSQSVTSEFEKIIEKTDLIVGTEEEIKIAGGASNSDLAMRKMRKRTNALIVVKLGASGSRVYQKGAKPINVASYPTEILHAKGAGDAFMAGFLFGWLRGESYKTCAKYGNANSAINISRHGCAPAMASKEELECFMNKHFAKK